MTCCTPLLRCLALLLPLLLAGCGGQADGTPPGGDGAGTPVEGTAGGQPAQAEDEAEPAAPMVRGKVRYRTRKSLSKIAEIEAELLHRLPDGSWEELSRFRLRAGGRQVPIGFRLPYDPAQVDPEGAYMVRARISETGTVLYEDQEGTPVLTGGHPSQDLDIMLFEVPR